MSWERVKLGEILKESKIEAVNPGATVDIFLKENRLGLSVTCPSSCV